MTGSDIFSFLTGERTVVYDEIHGDSRLGNLLERNSYRIFRRTDGISNVNVRNTGDGYDGTDLCFTDIYFI